MVNNIYLENNPPPKKASHNVPLLQKHPLTTLPETVKPIQIKMNSILNWNDCRRNNLVVAIVSLLPNPPPPTIPVPQRLPVYNLLFPGMDGIGDEGVWRGVGGDALNPCGQEGAQTKLRRNTDTDRESADTKLTITTVIAPSQQEDTSDRQLPPYL